MIGFNDNLYSFRSTEEILSREEENRKAIELEENREKELQERYIRYVKDRLKQILNNNELLTEYFTSIDRYGSLLGYKINYKNDKNLTLAFDEIMKFNKISNDLGIAFLESNREFIEYYFKNISTKMNKKEFILFISFLEYGTFIKLIIVYDLFLFLPDEYKKILIDSTNESIHYTIINCHPEFIYFFENIVGINGEKKYGDLIRKERIKDKFREKLQLKK